MWAEAGVVQRPLVESRPDRVEADGQLVEDTGLLADLPGLHRHQRQLRDSWSFILQPGALQVHIDPGVDVRHFHANSLQQTGHHINCCK